MNKSSYDTKDGIQKMIISLHGFNELLKLRREASKKEELNEFIILGRWCLDSRGDLGKVSVESARKERKEMLPNIPDVLTREEFSNLICERNIYEERKISFSVTVGSHVVIPPADLHCGKCQLKWDVAKAAIAFGLPNRASKWPLLTFRKMPLQKLRSVQKNLM